MSYLSWFNEHKNKHKKVLNKLLKQNFSKEQIIDYFSYENMLKTEPDFCPLYAQNKKCHEMDNLNCYLCACPNFRFNDAGIKEINNKTQYSFCTINSKDGKQSTYGNKIHQNCSSCKVPHHKSYITNHYNQNWELIMKEVQINS